MKYKSFAILGLGIFGTSLARNLCRYGHEVIAIDNDLSLVEAIKDDVTSALALDFTDIEQLKEAGIDNYDFGVITAGSMLEETILGILNLKELGVKRIIAKSNNKRYNDILLKIGANEIVSPESDAALTFAKKLSSEDILELFDLESDVSIFEFKVPEEWNDKSLAELNFRSKYHATVVAIKRDNKTSLNIDPQSKLHKEEILLIAGDDHFFKNI